MPALVLLTRVGGHPFAQVGYLWMWGYSFDLICGLKEGISPISSSLVVSFSLWAFWRSCNCLQFLIHSRLTPLTGLMQYTLGSQSCSTTENSWSSKWSWILLWPLEWSHNKTKLPSGMDNSFPSVLRAHSVWTLHPNINWYAAVL